MAFPTRSLAALAICLVTLILGGPWLLEFDLYLLIFPPVCLSTARPDDLGVLSSSLVANEHNESRISLRLVLASVVKRCSFAWEAR